jgi:hypothetical protein
MTENEQAQLANYISNAELTDGFEYGFRSGMANLGRQRGDGMSIRDRMDSFNIE